MPPTSNETEPGDDFTQEVRTIVLQINAWMNIDNPDPIKLMPALAVVLGRVTARSASDLDDITLLLDKAVNVMRNAALEDWESRNPGRGRRRTYS